MDPIKQQFIQEVLASSKGKNSSNVIPFLMTMAQKAQNSNINFSDQETQTIYQTLKSTLSEQEQQKLDQMWTILQMRKKHS